MNANKNTLDVFTRLDNLRTLLSQTTAILKEREQIRVDVAFIELALSTR
jgi:hypothetical protein